MILYGYKLHDPIKERHPVYSSRLWVEKGTAERSALEAKARLVFQFHDILDYDCDDVVSKLRQGKSSTWLPRERRR